MVIASESFAPSSFASISIDMTEFDCCGGGSGGSGGSGDSGGLVELRWVVIVVAMV